MISLNLFKSVMFNLTISLPWRKCMTVKIRVHLRRSVQDATTHGAYYRPNKLLLLEL